MRAGQLGDALAFKPDLALIACGANDAPHLGYDEASAVAVDNEIAAMCAAAPSDVGNEAAWRPVPVPVEGTGRHA